MKLDMLAVHTLSRARRLTGAALVNGLVTCANSNQRLYGGEPSI